MTQPEGDPPERTAKRLHVVLHQPEIAPNVGAVGRTCVALDARLWLIRPWGFQIEEKRLRRAGLDYWARLDWADVADWDEFLATPRETDLAAATQRLPWFFTKTAERTIYDAEFAPGDALVFGSESRGLPDSLLERYADRRLRIPISANVRSLNLSCAVAVAAYEAMRQIGFAERAAENSPDRSVSDRAGNRDAVDERPKE